MAVSPGRRPSVRTLRMHSFTSEFNRLTALASAAGIDPADVVLPAEGIVRADDGVRLHYLEWPGPATEPLLLFLHGGGLHAHSFDAVGLLLRRLGRCVALDLRGHGESDWAGPGGYGTDAVAADLDTVTTRFGARRVVLVGHSMGGMAALVWAARRPAVLAGLVVVDVGPDIDAAAGRSVNELISRRPLFADLDEADAFLSGVLPRTREAATSGVAQNLTWTDDGLLTWKHDTTQFQPGMGRIASPDELRRAAARITCPTLVLRGERSRVFGDEGAAELAALIPGARWERVPDAGHTIQTGNPRGLADAVTRFLRDQDDEGAE
ncbi:alpha/beta hydrolase [Streptosporangium sp. NPDC049644]|uniref:alpha/beta fold hydrolase n=1 Tax=Streptosporangium sp. NPDC049644 TaxID=3155507 RepID=UPI00341DCCAB